MAAAGAALVVFKLLRLPPVLGYLVAGALIGPKFLPIIPDADLDVIRRIADLGLAVLLFTLGVEFGWQRIRKLGLTVVFIGAVEVSLMVWVGYNTGLMLGWDGTESLVLGAALAQTSSAVLIKFLRDWGQLYSARGQLVLGISVVEDIMAVVLLSLLAGISATGAASAREISGLSVRLAIFAVAVLVLGVLIVPRVLKFIDRFKSSETLLLVSLGLCFGLALVAGELGLSAAAGAFLIGTVIGDTQHSRTISRVTAPVRDVFGAIFFVSVGMLVDFSMFGEALVPILLVTGVFIVGKVVFNSTAAFLAGYSGRTSVEVGTGMPLMGEFALAIAKVGADGGVVGAIVYPVIAGATALSSLLFPFIAKSHGLVVRLSARAAPGGLKRQGERTTAWLANMWHLTPTRRGGEPVKRASLEVAANAIIIAMLLSVGAVLLHYLGPLAASLGWGQGLLGLVMGAVVITLCVPSGLVVWKSLTGLTERAAGQAVARRFGPIGHARRMTVVRVVEHTVMVAAVLAGLFWSMPFVRELFAIGPLAAPLPVVVLLVTVLVTARLAVKVHQALESAFRRTVLGD